MADTKKLDKPSGGASDREAAEKIIFLLVVLLLLAALAAGIQGYIESLKLGSPDSYWSKAVEYFLSQIWPIWKLIAGALSALAIIGIIYSSWKLQAINIEEKEIYNPNPDTITSTGAEIAEPKNIRWEKVMKLMSSNNVSDWQLAIIEADVMLEEMLRLSGYHGESVGEMLKSVDKSDFLTVENAWEAHKVRNAIAHSGGTFHLTEREVRHTISLFEKVFKEFQLI